MTELRVLHSFVDNFIIFILLEILCYGDGNDHLCFTIVSQLDAFPMVNANPTKTVV